MRRGPQPRTALRTWMGLVQFLSQPKELVYLYAFVFFSYGVVIIRMIQGIVEIGRNTDILIAEPVDVVQVSRVCSGIFPNSVKQSSVHVPNTVANKEVHKLSSVVFDCLRSSKNNIY